MVVTVESPRSDTSGYTFRRLDMGELSLVNDLYNRCHHSERSLAEAEWLYRDHPYGEAILLGVLVANHELAAVLPAIAHRFVWDGQEEIGYQLIDAVTAPEHRGRGLFGHLVELICRTAEAQHFCVFAFPNAQSLSVYRKTGILESIGAWETHAKVLAWPAYAWYRLGHGHERAEQTHTSDAATLCDGDVSLVPIRRFESDFEEIHASAGNTILSFTLRRREFLNWRYFGSPQRHYGAALIKRAERAEGYVVVRVIDRIAHVIDVFVPPDGRTAGTAVRLLTRWARRMGAIAVYFSASGDNFIQRAFDRNGFLLKKRGGEIVLDPKSLHRLTSRHQRHVNIDDFYFVMGDGDFQ